MWYGVILWMILLPLRGGDRIRPPLGHAWRAATRAGRGVPILNAAKGLDQIMTQ